MKTFKALFVLIAVALAAVPMHAQTLLVPTTLSSAMDSSTRTMVVASGTNCIVGNLALIEKELVDIVAAPTTTTLQVRRGAAATVGVAHISGAPATCQIPGAFAPAISFAKVDQNGNPSGSCVRGKLLFLPVFNARFSTMSDCLGGTWVTGDSNNGDFLTSRFRIESASTGGTAYTSVGTDTAMSATTMYCSEMFLPTNKLLTGIGLLNGATETGNLRYAILYDSAGNALVNSPVAGQATVTANVYEQYPFASKYLAVGPQQYFVCAQDNAVGSTTARMFTTGTNANILTKGQTAAVFGTIAPLVVPSTFTSVVGIYAYLY